MKSVVEQNFATLEAWINRRGFILLRSKHKKISDEVDFDRNIVFITKRSTPIHQFYSALHECGHIIVRSKKDYGERFKASLTYNEDMRGKLTFRCLVEEIEEEILAWREGEKLCKKLNIALDVDKYYTYSSRWVMTYIVKAGLGKEYLLGNKSATEKVLLSIKEENLKKPEEVLDAAVALWYDGQNDSDQSTS